MMPSLRFTVDGTAATSFVLLDRLADESAGPCQTILLINRVQEAGSGVLKIAQHLFFSRALSEIPLYGHHCHAHSDHLQVWIHHYLSHSHPPVIFYAVAL